MCDSWMGQFQCGLGLGGHDYWGLFVWVTV